MVLHKKNNNRYSKKSYWYHSSQVCESDNPPSESRNTILRLLSTLSRKYKPFESNKRHCESCDLKSHLTFNTMVLKTTHYESSSRVLTKGCAVTGLLNKYYFRPQNRKTVYFTNTDRPTYSTRFTHLKLATPESETKVWSISKPYGTSILLICFELKKGVSSRVCNQ